jgi:hypothetical protein
MTFPELYAESRKKLLAMRRDESEFAAFNVTAADIDAFEDLIGEFMNLSDDEEMLNQISIATDNKDAVREEIYVKLRDLRARAKVVYAADKAKFKTFTVANMTLLNDEELLFGSRAAAVNAREDLTELAAAGLTAAMIDALDAKNDEFEKAMQAKQAAVAAREAETATRTKKFNELYSLLTKYCGIGKAIWGDRSEAHYNDYLIYTGQPKRPGRIVKLAFDAAAGRLEWKENMKATEYEAAASVQEEGGDWKSFYVGEDNYAAYDVEPGETVYFRVRGVNEDAKGKWSAVLRVSVAGN